MAAIKLQNVHFAYRKGEPILKDINIDVPVGSIYGFLGANGAGKSTTLRLILSLMKPQSGTIELFGSDIRKTYPKHLRKVGSMIESASLYHHLSATDNLRLACKYFNINRKLINPLLGKVSLQDAKNKKVKDFSTGMKQRLGLALSLLHDPDLLILDEPTNGLDPNGIIALRAILNSLRDEGKTILLSSHILSEVEKIVSNIGIINNGSVAFEGSIEELQQFKSRNLGIGFRVSDVSKVVSLFPDLSIEVKDEHHFELTLNDEDDLPAIIKKMVLQDIDLYEVVPATGDLENMFLSITNN